MCVSKKHGICYVQEAAGRADKRPGEEARCSTRDARQTSVTASAAASQSRSESVIVMGC